MPCPVACIHRRGGQQQGDQFLLDHFDTCIDCGICLQVFPVKRAILAEERPDRSDAERWPRRKLPDSEDAGWPGLHVLIWPLLFALGC